MSRSRLSRWARSLGVALSLAGAAGVALEARADDPPEVVQARQDFREGVSLMAAEDWAGALAKFQRVARVKVNAPVAFNMAECEEHLGKWVSALGNYRLASAKAADGSAPEVAAHVDERIAALEKKLPHLAVKKKEPTPNPKAHVELDGVELQPTQLDKPMAVDPGERVVTVVVSGKTASTKKIKLAEGASESVEVAIPAPAEPPGGGGGAGGGEPTPRSTGPSVPGVVLTTIGAATSVVGIVFIGLRQKAIGDLDTLCGGDDTCPKSAESTYDEGRTFTGVAEVTIPVGVIALTTGIVLLATKKSPKSADAAPTTGWALLPAAHGADAGLSLGAIF
ncbi:MAG: hypothetical protein U0414_44025 [Polyangiaceae bacterium]